MKQECLNCGGSGCENVPECTSRYRYAVWAIANDSFQALLRVIFILRGIFYTLPRALVLDCISKPQIKQPSAFQVD